ncbi:uncharacterized protein At1g66480 [Amborella trichopoda]|uniref:uncharacterized protein At1g66480 n=1 Tax=Amborella trichopoda TaxID=13333 RepID=UPI0005D4239A|nr:uncharacterized protein At1g66480 [Amborella trichopoda]|eukprot:XP_006838369.2 uncharacterized protein At1g66480 [Amborella trichopoda]
MGNSIGRRSTAKIMRVDGETLKLKAPVRVEDVLADHPGHVLIDYALVRELGIRAQPLGPDSLLMPRRVYFLVQKSELPPTRPTRRVRSAVPVAAGSAKERLDGLLLARRTVSDLSPMVGEGGGMRVRMRLPKAQVVRLMEESADGSEAAERILELCMEKEGREEREWKSGELVERGWRSGELEKGWRPGLGSIQENCRPKEKRGVRFQPIQHGELVQ